MRVKRFKKAQKVLSFYEANFGFKEPYQVIIDGTFSLMALRRKINIADQLPKYLDSECILVTTVCCLKETENLGPELYGALCILRQFKLITCGHKEKPLPASACIHMLTKKENPEKYFVATQDTELQEKLTKQPSTPLLYLHHQSITLVKPSLRSTTTANNAQAEKTDLTAYEKNVLASLKKKEFGDKPTVVPRKKKRGPKQPNSLSCKKSKKVSSGIQTTSEVKPAAKSKRRHKRLRMSDELKAIHEKLLKKQSSEL